MESLIQSQNPSTIYGPVSSWRFGLSIGIDLLFYTSTCSFNCIYCQLGDIQQKTSNYKTYVSTDQVLNDFDSFIQKQPAYDCITFSGSGEPTLANNLGLIVRELRAKHGDIKFNILTNGTMLGNSDVINDLQTINRVIIKLDAPNEKIFNAINRPVDDISFANTLENIKNFRKIYTGIFDIQIMLMPINYEYIDEYIKILQDLKPDHIQLNTPKRPYPLSWHRKNRGDHINKDKKNTNISEFPTRTLKVLTLEDIQASVNIFKEHLGSDIISISH